MGDNVAACLKDVNFVQISHKSLVTIVQNEKVNSNSELANACISWAKRECVRQGIPQNCVNIRQSLGEDVLRYLTVEPSECEENAFQNRTSPSLAAPG